MRKKFAVIGHPIEHSRSPELHHAFAAKMGIELDYQKRLAAQDGFDASIDAFFADQGQGLNVTVPFKEQAFARCDVVTERAKIAQAVNTLWYQDGLLHGDNTDGQGLVAAITALAWPLHNARVLILGAGGATRGVIYPLFQAGVAQICIANRTYARALHLQQDILQHYPDLALDISEIAALSGHYDLVINATSASLSGAALQLPAALRFDYAYEMAYGKDSDFLALARQRQVPASDGFSMLVGQAIEAFEIWHGCRPELQDFLDASPHNP
ncbi:shikimate dehydrogenase [Acinetobacter larvae]|uniref:Shikimate dehydrogenase (NADP(+)) n=1 Tax=Acinetobacter larvae TaxID=1789224 RepID=A0A1B2LW99_9GAMM|nr:shikimate dehydrogenase [Acinetobacter larvae]AOA57228.1 shikimate dehydrogenase [Acinetobacter larvae]